MSAARQEHDEPASRCDGRPARRVGDPTATRSLRVLHIVDSLAKGGAERAVWDLVRLADPTRVQSRIVTVCSESADSVLAEPLQQAGFYSRALRRLRADSWEARLLDPMPVRGKELLWSMLGPYQPCERTAHACGRVALEYLRFRPDIIHGHVCYGLRVGAWLKAWTRKPLVYSVWNSIAQLHDEGIGWVVDDYRRLHHAADAVFVEPTVRQSLTALGFSDDRIQSFIATIDFEGRVDPAIAAASESRAAVRHRLGIPAGAAVALSVGRLIPAKGHRYALEALPHAIREEPSLHWLLLGEGDERASLLARVASLGLSDRVHVVGYADDPYPYYAAADVYLRTVLLEGENRASYDAMAFGLPIVGFDTGHALDRIAAVGNGVLVPTGDSSALAAALVEILRQPDRGRACGLRGQRDARQHLGVRDVIELFAHTYLALHRRQAPARRPAALRPAA